MPEAHIDLTTKYLGLTLNNPIVVASSGLTRTIEGVKACEAAGAGAIVLKSIFEEQITAEAGYKVQESVESLWHPEAYEYVTEYSQENSINDYLTLIREAKAQTSIPIIASIHCSTPDQWTQFARKIEQAGADALELNISIPTFERRTKGIDIEKMYVDILKGVKNNCALPIAMKVGYFFTNLWATLTRFSNNGADGLVLFNRFFHPDFDIKTMTLRQSNFISNPDETVRPLRWIAILSEEIESSLSASTGIHNSEGVIKHLLAGADTVQVCSVLYKNGINTITEIKEGLISWMKDHAFTSLADFHGTMNMKNSKTPAAFERMQYMKLSFDEQGMEIVT